MSGGRAARSQAAQRQAGLACQAIDMGETQGAIGVQHGAPDGRRQPCLQGDSFQ